MYSSEEIQRYFQDKAESLSPALTEALHKAPCLEAIAPSNAPFALVLCRSVAGQQLSTKAAASIWQRVINLVCCEQSEEEQLHRLSQLSTEELRSCGLSNAKCRTITEVLAKHASGALNGAELQHLPDQERDAVLTQIWGIGQWTADMMAIFYFARPDVWPEGDLAVQNTLQALTSKRRKNSRTAKHFAPYRSYLARYMWQHLDNPPI